jgi:hypothetical protein
MLAYLHKRQMRILRTTLVELSSMIPELGDCSGFSSRVGVVRSCRRHEQQSLHRHAQSWNCTCLVWLNGLDILWAGTCSCGFRVGRLSSALSKAPGHLAKELVNWSWRSCTGPIPQRRERTAVMITHNAWFSRQKIIHHDWLASFLSPVPNECLNDLALTTASACSEDGCVHPSGKWEG